MSLNEKDIIDAIESYKNANGLSGTKMAELCGMSSKSVYSEISSGKTKSLKSKYLVSFLINTKISPEEFFGKFDMSNTEKAVNIIEEPNEADFDLSACKNPRCIKRINELEEDKRNLQEFNKVLQKQLDAKKGEQLENSA